MFKSLCFVAGLIFCSLALSPGAALAVDLQEQYPPTLDVSPKPRGYAWTCDKTDVWRLKNFTLAVGDAFKVELNSAQLVLGRHESNVLWGVVFPNKPGEIVKAEAGQGDHVTSVWLRFHPARLRELFPAEAVIQRGVDSESALQVFDRVWTAFDREYAMFVVKPEVDWSKRREEFRPRASEATDNFELAELLAELLANLQDLHVAVRVNGFDIPGFTSRRPLKPAKP